MPDNVDEIVLCSDCIANEGLRLEAIKLGTPSGARCPNCCSMQGAVLDKAACDDLIEKFFIDGTRSLGPFGVSPYMSGVGNEHDISFDVTLQADFEKLLSVGSTGLRLRAPRTYLVGDTEFWEAFDTLIKLRLDDKPLPETLLAVVDEVIDGCPVFTLPKGTRFFRIRKNPDHASDPFSYDAAPLEMCGASRFAGGAISIMYGGFHVETCIHESRCRIDDEICIATLETSVDLPTLNLVDPPYDAQKLTPWTSPSIFLRQVMRSSNHDECQLIGERAFARGIAAIQFPSFFSQVLDEQRANIAILGSPIVDRKVTVRSFNRVKLERARYDYSFGPVFDTGERDGIRS
jgi:hypothetical protein